MMLFGDFTVALAADVPYLPETAEFPIGENEAHNGYGLVIQNYTSKTVIKKLKSSDKSVIKASWTKKDKDCIQIDCLKPGKATITGVLYQGKKEIGAFKIEATVYQYDSPVKSFKLNNKDYAKKLKKDDQYNLTIKKKEKFMVSIKPNDGWTLQFIEFYDGKKLKNIENNSTITCKRSNQYVNVFFHNSKINRTESVVIYINK